MFGTAVKGIRGSDAQVRIVNVRDDASFWTTVVVPSECTGELYGFNDCIGMSLPVPTRYITATKHDTNLRQANQIPFDAFAGRQFEWHVPAVAPARFQPDWFHEQVVDYDVQPSDVAAFASSALIRFMLAQQIVVSQPASIEAVSKVLRDDALMYHQIIQRLPEGQEVQIRESDCIRAHIKFAGGRGPKFGNGASIPVILAWRGTSGTRV